MKNGFSLFNGNKLYFLESENVNITENIVSRFIEKIGSEKGLCKDIIEKCLQDQETRKKIRFLIDRTTLEYKGKDNWKYIYLSGKNFGQSIPEKEIENYLIMF